MTQGISIRVQAGHASDSGGREINDERLLVDEALGLALLADGFSGRAAPEIASRTAVELVSTAMREFEETLAPDADRDRDAFRRRFVEELPRMISRASEALYTLGEKHEEWQGMAASLVVFKRLGRACLVGHVGSCRVYTIRQGRIFRLTDDHTLGEEMAQRGTIRRDALEGMRHRDVVVRAVGEYPTVAVDTLLLDTAAGEIFLLCSKGLPRVVEEDEMLEIITEHEPEVAARRLVELAVRRKPRMNVSALVLRVGDSAEPERLGLEQKIRALMNNFMFRDLSFQEVVRVLRMVEEVTVKKGAEVFHQGDAGEHLYVIVTGSVDISRDGAHLTNIGPGGHFGELSLVLDPVRSATVTAAEPTLLLAIGRERLDELMRDEAALTSKLLIRFLQAVGQRVRDLTQDYAELRGRSAR
jgi:PPM family protein phosphatase